MKRLEQLRREEAECQERERQEIQEIEAKCQAQQAEFQKDQEQVIQEMAEMIDVSVQDGVLDLSNSNRISLIAENFDKKSHSKIQKIILPETLKYIDPNIFLPNVSFIECPSSSSIYTKFPFDKTGKIICNSFIEVLNKDVNESSIGEFLKTAQENRTIIFKIANHLGYFRYPTWNLRNLTQLKQIYTGSNLQLFSSQYGSVYFFQGDPKN